MSVELPAEVKAMADIAHLFADLEEDEIQRVLRWANEKYRARGSAAVSPLPFHGTVPTTEAGNGGERREFADLPEIMDVAKPTNGLERILVAGYFNQVVNGDGDFDSQTVNTQLKHLGYPSANITRDMERLTSRSPKLVIQTRKEGSAQQARKKFRLTVEGMRAVEAMLKKAPQLAE